MSEPGAEVTDYDHTNECSFCGYVNTPGDKIALTIGTRASICSECLKLCNANVARSGFLGGLHIVKEEEDGVQEEA